MTIPYYPLLYGTNGSLDPGTYGNFAHEFLQTNWPMISRSIAPTVPKIFSSAWGSWDPNGPKCEKPTGKTPAAGGTTNGQNFQTRKLFRATHHLIYIPFPLCWHENPTCRRPKTPKTPIEHLRDSESMHRKKPPNNNQPCIAPSWSAVGWHLRGHS